MKINDVQVRVQVNKLLGLCSLSVTHSERAREAYLRELLTEVNDAILNVHVRLDLTVRDVLHTVQFLDRVFVCERVCH